MTFWCAIDDLITNILINAWNFLQNLFFLNDQDSQDASRKRMKIRVVKFLRGGSTFILDFGVGTLHFNL